MTRLFCFFGLLLAAPFLLSLAPDMLVSFEEQSSWSTSKAEAMNAQKLFFVDFDANYCAACRQMDRTTFMDVQLADYMKQKVVALKVDVQEIDGMRWSQQYEIEALPTMLVFDEKGRMVKRLVGYQSAEDLLTTFKELAPKQDYEPAAQDQPLSTPEPQKEELEVETTVSAEPPKPENPKPAITASSQPTPEPPAKEKELYELSIRRTKVQGYSTQVGVFSSYENVLDLAEKIGQQMQQKTFVEVERLNGKTVYRLLVGLFPSRRQASVMRNNLLMKGHAAIIYQLGMPEQVS